MPTSSGTASCMAAARFTRGGAVIDDERHRRHRPADRPGPAAPAQRAGRHRGRPARAAGTSGRRVLRHRVPRRAAARRRPVRAARRVDRSGSGCAGSAFTACRTATPPGARASCWTAIRGELRIVTCHLGAGASLAAVRGGRSVDTTMGFTPLEGLVMATRSGSVDPGPDHLAAAARPAQRSTRWPPAWNSRPGWPACPGSGRATCATSRPAADAGDPAARLAIEVYLHRLRREIAAMAAAMNGLDALVFTGGIGEHDPAIRAAAAAGLEFLGISIDAGRNQAHRRRGSSAARSGRCRPGRHRQGGHRDRPAGPRPADRV